MSAITLKNIKTVVALFKEHSSSKDTTVAEFIQEKLKSYEIPPEVVKIFVTAKKHEELFTKTIQNFWETYKIKPSNETLLIVVLTLVIFKLNLKNYDDLAKVLAEVNYKHGDSLLEYFTKEDTIVSFTLLAVSIYTDEYVLDTLLNNVLTNKKLLVKLQAHTKEAITPKVIKKLLTVPKAPKCTRFKPKLIAPCSTPEPKAIYRASEIPSTTFKEDEMIQNKLSECYEKNRIRALELFQFAQKQQFSCAKLKKPVEKLEKPTEMIKATPVPPQKPMEIKENAATVMRRAARLAKEHEEEIRKLEKLCNGEFDDSKIEEIEEEFRREKRKLEIENVERKHLQGLLTYEEAIEAKQNLAKANKAKMEQFKMEQCAILAEIDRWKEEEEVKIRGQVLKIQTIEKNAKDAEKKMLEEKKCNAKLLTDETKKLLKEACEQKQAELERKVLLIQELRALNQLRESYVKKFDPTESPNFGLMCEMSIAELQERLLLLKMSMREELEEKRKEIANSRTRKTEMLENAKRFIEECKNYPLEKRKSREVVNVATCPKIVELKNKLEEARRRRLQAKKSY